ncbi:hypothetical protein [Pseudonocardia lacus]|uniref:hypothetical protein n=1 Tax=Pseudonocardia lacus TaxID=2835865 RepID=UPI001BDC9386|nr:hypothetical protein [Pseudonocardia lacus]
MPPLVRRGLLALALIGIGAAAFELYSEQHWNDPIQLIPWGALGALLLAALLVLVPGGRGVVPARVLAVLVLGASLYGVVQHVLTNLATGPLDPRFADTWAALPIYEQIWLAASKQVGSAPTLAPGVLGQTALVLLLATISGPRTGRHAYRR